MRHEAKQSELHTTDKLLLLCTELVFAWSGSTLEQHKPRQILWGVLLWELQWGWRKPSVSVREGLLCPLRQGPAELSSSTGLGAPRTRAQKALLEPHMCSVLPDPTFQLAGWLPLCWLLAVLLPSGMWNNTTPVPLNLPDCSVGTLSGFCWVKRKLWVLVALLSRVSAKASLPSAA